jgi:hypothetical protein
MYEGEKDSAERVASGNCSALIVSLSQDNKISIHEIFCSDHNSQYIIVDDENCNNQYARTTLAPTLTYTMNQPLTAVPSSQPVGEDSGDGEPHTAFYSFACSVPWEVAWSAEDTLDDGASDLCVAPKSFPTSGANLPSDLGVVGTITVLGRTTVLIWLGWGRVMAASEPGALAAALPDSGAAEASASTTIVGTGMSWMSWLLLPTASFPCVCDTHHLYRYI